MAGRKLIELLIDENADAFGVEAISLVKYPAIESNFVYFSKQDKARTMYSMASVDEEKRTLIGPALIPDKRIPRYDDLTGEEYDVYFSKATCQQASELFLKTHRTSEHTFEHESPVDGVHVVESWMVTNPSMDKSRHFGLDVPEGTWMVRVQVENDEMWTFVKEQKVAGFSIEGYFLDKLEEMSARPEPSLGRKLKSLVTGRKLYAEVETDSGAVFATEEDEFTAGVPIYKIGIEGTAVEVSNGSYKTKAGTPFEVYDNVVVDWDGQVQEVEEQAEATETTNLKDEYMKKYEEKLQTMSKHRVALSGALNDWWVFLDPYDYNYRNQGFYIYPFQHRSYSDYLEALEDAKMAIPQVEEWENADSDGWFEYTTSGVGISEDEWNHLNELAQFAADGRIPFDAVMAADNHFGKSGARYLDDAYYGRFDKDVDFAWNMLENLGEPPEGYFDYEQFGYDIRVSGDLDMHLEDYPEDREMFERMSDSEVGEYFHELGDTDSNMRANYFDVQSFARDLMFDYVEIEKHYWYQH